MSQPDRPSPVDYVSSPTNTTTNATITPTPTSTASSTPTLSTPNLFPSFIPNTNNTQSRNTTFDDALSERGSDSGLISNISFLFYLIAAIGVISAILYTVLTSRRNRKANRQRLEEEETQERHRATSRRPLTYRPDADDEGSPPQYFDHELDQPYIGPETLELYPEEVLYGGRVPVPAGSTDSAQDSSSNTSSSTQATQQNNAAAHRRSSSRSAGSDEVVIDMPTINAPSPALSLDGHSTTVNPHGEEDHDDNSHRRRHRVSFGRHSFSALSPRRLLHRRGSHHSNATTNSTSSSTSLHRISSRNSSSSARSRGSSNAVHPSHESETTTTSAHNHHHPRGLERTASSISALVDSIQVPQPAMVETPRTSSPPVLNRLRSEGPPPYVADVRPEDAPPLPPAYSAVISALPSLAEEEHMEDSRQEEEEEERLDRPRRT